MGDGGVSSSARWLVVVVVVVRQGERWCAEKRGAEEHAGPDWSAGSWHSTRLPAISRSQFCRQRRHARLPIAQSQQIHTSNPHQPTPTRPSPPSVPISRTRPSFSTRIVDRLLPLQVPDSLHLLSTRQPHSSTQAKQYGCRRPCSRRWSPCLVLFTMCKPRVA